MRCSLPIRAARRNGNRRLAVFVAAANVGGILLNDTRPAEFLFDNLMIEAMLSTRRGNSTLGNKQLSQISELIIGRA